MFNHHTFASLALAACLFPACAHDQAPPAATRADLGDVHLVETIRSCAVNRSADEWVPTTPDEVTVKVDLMISNASGKATTVFPGRLRLSDAKIDKECTPEQASEAVSIPPGATRQIAVEFHGSGDFSCHDPFRLKVRGAIEEAGRPLALSR
jgi:hypothetical protein